MKFEFKGSKVFESKESQAYPRKVHKWSINTWKDAHHQRLLEKWKWKEECGTTSISNQWIKQADNSTNELWLRGRKTGIFLCCRLGCVTAHQFSVSVLGSRELKKQTQKNSCIDSHGSIVPITNKPETTEKPTNWTVNWNCVISM